MVKFIIASLLLYGATAQADVFHGTNGDAIPTPNEIAYQGSVGIKVVRISVFIDPAEVKNMGEAHYFIATVQWLAWLDYVLPLYKENGIKVILTMTYPPGGYDSQRRAIMLKTPNHWGREYFKAVWRFVAFKYKDEDAVLGFDLINEPHNSADKLFKYQEEVTAEIRAVTDKLVIQTSSRGRCIDFKDMKPSRFPNVKYTCHVYEPWRLTHQGTRADRPTGYEYPSSKFPRKLVKRELNPVAKFAQKVGAENIYIGEGAVSWYASNQTRATWTRELLDMVRPYNWTLFFMGIGQWKENPWEPNGELLEMLKRDFK